MPDPHKDATGPLRDRLIAFGGRNPYGLPNWRVCLAQHCIEIVGGIFHRSEDGELSIFEEEVLPDGSVRLVQKEVSLSVEHVGYMRAPKYPCEGWILERWFPAHQWGARDWWESQKAEDGLTPLMGPYPEQGEYMMLAGPWDHAPEISDMENAIAQYRKAQADRPTNLDAHMKQVLKTHEDRIQNEREMRRERYIDTMQRVVKPLMQSPSLSAQRLRNELARDMHLNTHLAAGDF